jgi:glc operon protein GlcG
MDGGALSSINVAINKANSAARERKPTKEIGKAARNPETGFDISYFGDRCFTGWGGGVPVFKDGKVIGAVAVAGLPETEDVEIAEMAVALLTS